MATDGKQSSLNSILGPRPALSLMVALALVIGFFHGWLKLHYRTPVVTFLFDAALCGALLACVLTLPQGVGLFPGNRVSRSISLFYVVVFTYAIIPSGVPWIIRLASVRGWCFPPLMLCLGYHLSGGLRQVRALFYLVVALGVLTGVYGIRQSPEEISRRMLEDEYFAERFQGTAYASDEGRGAIRHFSTFVTAGAFGGTMALTAALTLVLLLDDKTKQAERILLAVALVIMLYGIVLSGSRTPVMMLVISTLVIVWFRRRFSLLLLIGVAGYLSIHWGIQSTGGAAADRFGSLLEEGTVKGRFLMPFLATMATAEQSVLGSGVGSSGYSVPFFMVVQFGRESFKGAEGDLHAAMTEMGVIGVVAFFSMLFTVLRVSIEALRQMATAGQDTLPLAVATAIVPSIIAAPIGSGFLGIPGGALFWILVGSLIRLSELHDQDPHAQGMPTSSYPWGQRKRYQYWRPPNRPRR